MLQTLRRIFPLSLLPALFFFNDTATTEIYTLSLHDALPISGRAQPLRGHPAPAHAGHHEPAHGGERAPEPRARDGVALRRQDRKSTRLNSSHANISYAVFCLKKNKRQNSRPPNRPLARHCLK